MNSSSQIYGVINKDNALSGTLEALSICHHAYSERAITRRMLRKTSNNLATAESSNMAEETWSFAQNTSSCIWLHYNNINMAV